MTDTPIYDQIRQEFASGSGSSDHQSRSPAPAPRRPDGARRPVSVWALVDQHRRGS